MLDIYGIKNCNTVKKSLHWLDENKIEYIFHDYKKEGVSDIQLQNWIDQLGWEPLVNKKGTTWRQLTTEEKNAVVDSKSAIALMKIKTSVIKRPLISRENKVLVLGFDEETYKNTFK